MARIRFTKYAQAYMAAYGISVHEVIDVIANFEEHETDFLRSGFIRVGKYISGKKIWAIYTAREDSLIVLAVSVEEVSS